MNLFRRNRTRWQDVDCFIAARIPPAAQKFVTFDIHQARNRIAKINVAIIGRNSALPDTYGLSADDLAGLMAQWRALAVARNCTD